MCARVAHEFDLLPRSPRANSGVVQNSGQFGAILSLGACIHSLIAPGSLSPATVHTYTRPQLALTACA
eukprot:6406671-Prymnesium_polylepis.1